ncbi:MAG: PQQ-dependent dehydrogenase, methanol/ethanol family [Novosphingobium sp.]|nr:PQQ-dependent dehydrogenase, methanol/ethanol family [Novosphingobium sp.]
MRLVALLAGSALLAASIAPISLDAHPDQSLASARGGDWPKYGGSDDEQRHSSLQLINRSSVGQLGVAWTHSLQTNRGVEATPIVVGKVMYVTSAWSVVQALDARTGRLLWTYDPSIDRSKGVDACCDVVNRGVAVAGGLVYLGALDGRLIALDARTGSVRWSAMTVDPGRPYTITGAPRVVGDLVLIGNSGAEFGVRGFLSAYGAGDGKLRWRFYTTPNPSKKNDGAASDSVFASFANSTWGDTGEWVRSGGGGTVWDSIVYDSVNDQIVFGVGNGSPWNQRLRDPARRDNLFLSSIVAVDRKTGEYRWHFQTTPGDQWDYTATQSIILADLPIDGSGVTRRVVLQAPKNGFFYVLDAKTGAFVSGTPFVPVNWASGLTATGRPVFEPDAEYGDKPHLQLPGPLGAHNWHPMAYSPTERLAYIPAQELAQLYEADRNLTDSPTKWNTGINFAAGLPQAPSADLLKGLRASLKGRLIAWDPVARKARWTVEHDNAWAGGVLSTAGGLVFQGRLDGTLSAYDSATGKVLWQGQAHAGIAAAPITYEIDGEQYVAVTTGWGSMFALLNGFAFDKAVAPSLGRVVVFKLGAKGTIPTAALVPIERKPATEPFGNEAMRTVGLRQYARNCMVCHGVFAISSGVLPDLRWSPVSADAEAWRSVVLGGVLSQNGMVSFKSVLTEQDAEAIRAYVVAEAHNGTRN